MFDVGKCVSHSHSANVPNAHRAALRILYPNCRSLSRKSPVSHETEIKATRSHYDCGSFFI